ncbi:hypothetical protein EON63_14765 [archaeon]|nr:MAG: hypothetical protein EON63_14765 [archaeon]
MLACTYIHTSIYTHLQSSTPIHIPYPYSYLLFQVIKEKIETYKKLRDELAAYRAELVVLQRTEQILKSRDANLEQFLTDLEKQKGVEVGHGVCMMYSV